MSAFDMLMSSQVRKAPSKTSSGYLILKGRNTVKESECHLLHFDGASKCNPGESSGGAILFSAERDPLYEIGEYIEHATNNIAEYTGLIIGLRLAVEKDITHLLIEGDSQLVIQQISGAWKIENNTLKGLNKEAKSLLYQFEFVAIRHIRRELNTEADRITNETIKNKESFVVEYQYS